MEMTLHRPGPHLSDCVAAMIHFSGFMPDFQREKLLPDGTMELIVDLSDRPKRLFRDEVSSAGDDFRKAWISGVHGRPIVIEAQAMAEMLVIAFTPGGAVPFIGTPADALTDSVFGLEAVLGNSATSLRDRVLAGHHPQAMFALAEGWLLERSGGPARRDPLIAHLTRRIDTGGLSIRTLMEETGRSERHVQLMAQRWLGTSLKHYARMQRFQRVIGGIAAGMEPDWADLASSEGYFDQSHLSHEFVAFAGMTPGAFAARYAGLTDFLPIAAPLDCVNLQDRDGVVRA
jgi:AraC-like DNA-binding protein